MAFGGKKAAPFAKGGGRKAASTKTAAGTKKKKKAKGTGKGTTPKVAAMKKASGPVSAKGKTMPWAKKGM